MLLKKSFARVLVFAATMSAVSALWFCASASSRADGLGFEFIANGLTNPVLSRNGRVIIAMENGVSVRSVDGGPFDPMLPPSGANNFTATALSSDGSVVVGYGTFLGETRPMRWTAVGGTRLLIPTGPFSIGRATAVSGDGKVIFGSSGLIGFRWTQSTAAQALSNSIFPTGAPNDPRGASFDGSAVVGRLQGWDNYYYAFRGTIEQTEVLPYRDGPNRNSLATAVTPDGTITIGFDYGDGGVQWKNGTRTPLASPPSPNGGGVATAVSDDGRVIVGGGMYVWTPELGMVVLPEVLVCKGFHHAINYSSWNPTSISGDGYKVLGTSRYLGNQYGLWVLTLPRCPADFNNDGVVDDSDFSLFVIAYEIFLDIGGDLNYDCLTDDRDFTFFVTAYNELLCPE